ncbi:MAG: hypothetical protein ACD_60C00118G0013 [uncultured bacterium]|nr:MAG: hypothetical protein ACD_60C00118G0013 [uncultured bacterium]
MRCGHIDVIEVKVLKGYKLYLKFDDGSHGDLDISKLVPFKGIFEPLKNRDFFSRVTINPDVGTICWDNGADLSPTFLYENIQQDLL